MIIHTCISKELRQYRVMARDDSDSAMLNKMNRWEEFKSDMSEHNAIWRAFCGVYRREAHRRGLKVPMNWKGEKST
jgi:hypothetical protein